MKEKLSASQIKEKFNIEIGNESLYFISETSGSEGDKKTIFLRANDIQTTFKALFKSFGYNGEAVLVTAPPNHMYAAAVNSATNNLIYAHEINDLVKYINSNSVKYIFSAPSFIWNFREFLKINKEQSLFLTGEIISDGLFDYLKENNVNCYHFFGASECNLMGVKKMEDDYYDFILDDIEIKDNKLYSPYLCAGYIKDDVFYPVKDFFALNDVFEVKERKFRFLSRSDNFAKIDGNTVSVTEINKFLSSNKRIKDFIVFKTNAANELEQLGLVYISNDLEVEEIKKLILDNFNNFYYLPKKILKLENFPTTPLGKKDMARIREWMK